MTKKAIELKNDRWSRLQKKLRDSSYYDFVKILNNNSFKMCT